VREEGSLMLLVDWENTQLKPRKKIYVINPWSKDWHGIDPTEVTQDDLNNMILDESVVELIHREGVQTPGEFFRRYVEIVGPEAGGCAWFL